MLVAIKMGSSNFLFGFLIKLWVKLSAISCLAVILRAKRFMGKTKCKKIVCYTKGKKVV